MGTRGRFSLEHCRRDGVEKQTESGKAEVGVQLGPVEGPVWGSVRQAGSGSDKAEMRETRFKIIELVQKEYQRTVVCLFTIT
jgi:hypothetical protein